MFLEVGQQKHIKSRSSCNDLTPFSRFLRASGWNATNCIKKLDATLKWRREYGIYDTLTAESVKEHVRTTVHMLYPLACTLGPESASPFFVQCLNGKSFVFGYDIDGRPGFLDIAGRESSPEGPGRIRAYVWMMERAVEVMPRGVE